jgi:hypothetical protein
VADWCPDVKQHLEPLSKQSVQEVSQLFGLPAWQLSYWACMAGPIPTKLKNEALSWPDGHFFEALEGYLALEPQQSKLAEGGDRYVPAPGIADVVGKASEAAAKRGARPGAAAAAAPGGAEPEAAHAEPVASAGCSPALYHHYSSSPVQYRQYYE